jgi:VCBS repeat-containing protein
MRKIRLAVNGDGSFTYTPIANYNGTDSFTYKANDGSTDSNEATVSLTINPVNDAPVATDDSYSVDEDGTLNVSSAALGILSNDSDVDGDTLTALLVSGPANGTLTLNSDGSFTYTPEANYNGTDSFTYKANDGSTDSNEATVSLTINPVNDAPVMDAIADRTANEGELISFAATASDIDAGDTLVYSLDSAPAGAAIDPNTGQFTWTPADGDATASITVRATDSGGLHDTKTFNITVINVAPILTISGAASVKEGIPYTLNLSSVDPGADTISNWEINWGDGSTEDITGNPSTVSHTYLVGGKTYTSSATATDKDGTYNANMLDVQVQYRYLEVTSLTPTPSGFEVQFNMPLDASTLNLYDTQTAGFGPADITLTGSTGNIKGSMVVDASNGKVSFIKTGSPLAADTYTVTLRSGSNGFISTLGRQLDGNSDGTAGDNYTGGFTIGAYSGRTLSIADFMRGPGQAVNVPATATGIPVKLSDGTGVQRLDFTMKYNNNLLTINSVVAGASLPTGSTITTTNGTPGILNVSVAVNGTLTGSNIEIVKLDATVPNDAKYTEKHILDLTDISINKGAITARGDDGIHVVGYFGDTSGNAAYSTLDGQLLQRVLLGYDRGFGAYRNTDPMIIGDITGDGLLNSLDGSRILQEATWYTTGNPVYNRPEIPPIPTGIGPIQFGGPDPQVNIPGDIKVTLGDTITVPVNTENADGVSSVQIRLAYDIQVLQVKEISRGTVTQDFGIFVAGDSGGIIRIDTSGMKPYKGYSGSLTEITFKVIGMPSTGKTTVDLQWVNLNDGHMVIQPEPATGADSTDGLIQITAKTSPKKQLMSLSLDDNGNGKTRQESATDESGTESYDPLPKVEMKSISTASLVTGNKLNKNPKWVKKFVGGLARYDDMKGPNANIRVNIPVSVPVSKGV